jgi:preprotein translocase subunit SecD
MLRHHSSRRTWRLGRLALAAVLLGLLGCPAHMPDADPPMEWHHTPVSIQGRLAEDEPAETLTEAPVVGEEVAVYLHPQVQFSREDLRHVEVVPDSEPLTLQLWFTEGGAARVASVTEDNLGRRFALLVNGHVVSAPLMVRPLRPDPQIPVAVEVQLAQAEAEQLSRAISQTWPPEQTP